jgi:dolichyl-phosphate-mannose-protein mannosyltransferase
MTDGLGMKQNFLVWILVVFMLSFTVRAAALGAINQVVFDEVHFGKFISSYCCTHERFFDIHPPIGKLIIAAGAYLSGYSGDFSFDSIGQTYTNIPIAAIRMVPAFAGALLPVIIFILLRQTGVSLVFSLLGAIALMFDNALVVESRAIITDSILLSATFGSLALAFASIRSTRGWPGWTWAALSGIASGIAVGTKFTGLVAGALVCVLFAYRAYQGGRRENALWIGRGLLAVGMAGIVYLLGWMLHFSLLTMPGSGDVWGVPTGSFWQDLATTQRQMVSANYNLTADHPYGSKWWTWPFMIRSVFYWQGEGSQFIYLLGNPVVWWGGFLLFCIGILSMFSWIAIGTWSRVHRVFSSGAWVFILGYFMSYIPLMRVPRVLFLYHYLTPLLFSLLFAIWWLDGVVPRKKQWVFGIATGCILVGFIFISPITYGIPLSDFWQNLIFSISSWR